MFTEVPAFLLYCIVPWRKLFLSEQKLQQTELCKAWNRSHIVHLEIVLQHWI